MTNEPRQPESDSRKVLSSGVWSLAIRNSFFVINFGGQLILVRYLSPDAFGMMALALATAGVIVPLVSLSIPMGFIRSDGDQRAFDSAIVLSAISGLALVLISGTIWYALRHTWDPLVGRVFLTVVAAQYVTNVARIHLASYERDLSFKTVSISFGVASLIGISTAIALSVLFDMGVWALALREVIVGVLLLLFSLTVAPLRFRFSPAKDQVFELFRFGIKMIVATLGETLFARLPIFGVQSQFGTTWLGMFDRAFLIASLPTRALVPASESVSFAFYSKVSDEKDRISVGLSWSYFLISRGVAPVAIILILDAERVVRLLYGSEWTDAAVLLRALSVYALVFPLYSMAKSSAYAMGRHVWIGQGYGIGLGAVAIGIGVSLENSAIHTIPWALSIGAVLMSAYVFFRMARVGVRPDWSRLVVPQLLVVAIALFAGWIAPFEYVVARDILAIALWCLGTMWMDRVRLLALVRSISG